MEFHNVKGVIKKDYNLAHLTWFKVGGNAEFFFKPKDEEDLVNVLKQLRCRTQITVIGAGSNIIIRDGGIDGLVIKLTRQFSEIKNVSKGSLLVGAGCLNYNLAQFAQLNGISGFEFLVGIPGCIGGGVIMNAGSYNQEFKDVVQSINVVDFNGNTKNIPSKDISFGYRSTNLPKDIIITSVKLKNQKGDPKVIQAKMDEISNTRSVSQPITEKTGGSTFANPSSCKAWEAIDRAGMRGYRVGGALMSEKHCNFIINDGSATASDIERLGDIVKEKVYQKENITLKWEIKRIGKYV